MATEPAEGVAARPGGDHRRRHRRHPTQKRDGDAPALAREQTRGGRGRAPALGHARARAHAAAPHLPRAPRPARARGGRAPGPRRGGRRAGRRRPGPGCEPQTVSRAWRAGDHDLSEGKRLGSRDTYLRGHSLERRLPLPCAAPAPPDCQRARGRRRRRVPSCSGSRGHVVPDSSRFHRPAGTPRPASPRPACHTDRPQATG